MKTMKVILTGASLSQENKGINALTLGAILALLDSNPECEIELFNQNSTYDAQVQHGINFRGNTVIVTENYIWSSRFILCGLLHLVFSFMPARIKKIIFIDNLKIFYFVLMKLKRKKVLPGEPALNKLIHADYIVNCAEGDSFSDIYGMHVFLRQSLDKVLAIAYKKKFVIFPQTIGPFNSALAKRLSKEILKRAETIYVREKRSREYLTREFGELPNLKDASDMAFLMEPEKVDDAAFEKFCESGIVTGINISGFLYDHPTGKNKILGDAVDYAEISDEIIKSLLSIDPSIKVVFVSHVENEDYCASKKIVDVFIKRGFGDRLYVLHDGYTAPQLKYFLSRFEFFTGARMHACIGAFSTTVPTVPQAYSYKFIGITDKFGLGDFVIDLKKDTIDVIRKKIIDGYAKRDDIKKTISGALAQIKNDSLKCGSLP